MQGSFKAADVDRTKHGHGPHQLLVLCVGRAARVVVPSIVAQGLLVPIVLVLVAWSLRRRVVAKLLLLRIGVPPLSLPSRSIRV